MSENPTNFTPEQEASIHYRGGSLLVSAAAGSGKTRVLVERLLSRIDENDNIDEFLVITYTRSAAFELRERIYEELLAKLAKSPGNLRLRRQSLLCRGASIDTIHTFCAQILRENAYLVRLPPDFRVADESESAMIMNEAVDKVLTGVYESIKENNGLKELIDIVIEGRDDKQLIEILLNIYRKLRSTPAPHSWISDQMSKLTLSGINDISETDYGKYMLVKLRRAVSYCQNEMQRLRKEMMEFPDFELKYADSIDESNRQIDALINTLFIGWDDAREFKDVEFPRPKPVKGYDELKDIRSYCSKILKTCAKELENSSADHIEDIRSLSLAISALLQLITEFDLIYSDEKLRRGVVDFSDLEHLTLTLLIDAQTGDKTELAINISERFKEIMIDEYQDVNAVQELIFTAISKNNTNIFMVGDVKQSIYRFRLADPSIFLSKYNEFTEYDFSSTDKIGNIDNVNIVNSKNVINGKKLHLSKNFRSRSEILDAVNLVFSKIMSVEFGEMEYSEKEWLIPGRTDEEGIQGKKGMPYIDKRDDPVVEIDVLDMSALNTEDIEESPAAITVEAEYIAKKIKKIIDDKFMIPDGKDNERPAIYSDVVILLRSMKGRAWQYASALNELGIQADFPGGEGFFETIEVSAVLSLLSVIDNPMQDIPYASVLTGPVYGLTSDDLAEIRLSSKALNYYEAIKESAEHNKTSPETSLKCRKILSDLESLRSVSADMSADRFIWHVYNKTGLLGLVGAMKNGSKRRSNLILLAESARRFEQSGYKGLFGFLTYINNLQDRGEDITEDADAKIEGSGSQDSVRIMSIHKSKGLEFPIVIIANASKQNNFLDIRKEVVFHKDMGIGTMLTDKKRRIKYSTIARDAIRSRLSDEMMSEELRVLYVAMTRAREKLIITATFRDAENIMKKVSLLPAGKIAPQAALSMKSMAECVLAAAGDNNEVINVNIVTPEYMISQSNDKYDLQEIKKDFPVFENKATDILHDPDYKYPYQSAPDLPSKMTVTNMSSDDDIEAEHAKWVKQEREIVHLHPPPVFISMQKKMNAAEHGTLLHRVMQHLDYDKGSSDDDIRKALQRLAKMDIVTDEQLKEIDINQLISFFNSDIGRRIRNAKNLKREFKFSVLRSAELYFSEGGNDQILIQGIIDCFFEENDELVVLDFKTDKISHENLNERARQYAPQLDAYSDALESITGKRVKEKIIYFFSQNTAYSFGSPVN